MPTHRTRIHVGVALLRLFLTLLFCAGAARPLAAQGPRFVYCYVPVAETRTVFVSQTMSVGPISERASYGPRFSQLLAGKGLVVPGTEALCTMSSSETQMSAGRKELATFCPITEDGSQSPLCGKDWNVREVNAAGVASGSPSPGAENTRIASAPGNPKTAVGQPAPSPVVAKAAEAVAKPASTRWEFEGVKVGTQTCGSSAASEVGYRLVPVDEHLAAERQSLVDSLQRATHKSIGMDRFTLAEDEELEVAVVRTSKPCGTKGQRIVSYRFIHGRDKDAIVQQLRVVKKGEPDSWSEQVMDYLKDKVREEATGWHRKGCDKTPSNCMRKTTYTTLGVRG